MLLVLGGLFYPSHTQRMFVEVMTEADLGAALAALMIGAFVAMTTTLVMADIVVASAVVTAGVLAASGRVGMAVFFSAIMLAAPTALYAWRVWQPSLFGSWRRLTAVLRRQARRKKKRLQRRSAGMELAPS
jgi:hypothetical protein